MFAFLLNPRGKKRRSRKAKRRTYKKRYARKRYARKKRVSMRRRLSGIRAYRHRRALIGGQAARKAIQALACGPRPYRTLKRLRKKCPVKGVAAVMPATKIPGYIGPYEKNRRRYRNPRFKYRARNYSTWIPAYKNPSWVPSYAMNPNTTFTGKLAAGFRPGVLISAVPVVGGAIGNAMLASYVTRFLPGMLQTGFPNLLVGLATAGLLGAGIGMLAPRMGGPIFFGGVIEVVTRGVRSYILPTIEKVKSGISDYLTVGDAAAARPLGCYGGGCMGLYEPSPEAMSSQVYNSMIDWSPQASTTPESLGPQIGFSDYLTPAAAAAARPLGYLGYTMNDAAIESTATEELALES